MRILIVHDRNDVSIEIKSICTSSGVEDRSITIAEDGVQARRALSSNLYDLLIIDLTIPHIKGVDAPSYLIVDNLLKEIFLHEDLIAPGDIIGITKESSALNLVANSINPHVMTTIDEDSEGKWKSRLADKISYVSKASASRQRSVNSQYDFDLAVITALDKEMTPFRERYDFSAHSLLEGSETFLFPDKEGDLRRGVAFSVGKSGEARAASFTQSILSLFRPKLAVMSGICGGVQKKTALGDVVIADSALDWDYGKWEETDNGDGTKASFFAARPAPISIVDSAAHRIIRRFDEDGLIEAAAYRKAVSEISHGLIKVPSLHVAPMASGSAVIASDEIATKVRGLNESIRGIDMECFGFYHAARSTHVAKPHFLCVKSVSDFANGTKGDEYHRGAAFAAAMVAIQIFEEHWSF